MKRMMLTVALFSYASPLSEFAQKQLLLPPPPAVASESYALIDATTGAVIAEKNAHKPIPPGSVTKLMTSYVVFHALQQGHLHLDDSIFVSTDAWRMEGTRMFLNERSRLPLEDLLKGLIVVSGNDASVAITEHFAGSDANFSVIMNRYAEKLQMNDTHFANSTGLPDENQYSSAYDLAILSSHIIKDFPQYFHWFHEKTLSHNGITQQNRNSLLFNHPEVDGLKTGYTDKGGFCMATTAQRENTRLVVTTLNAPSVKARAQDALSLLNYGFRFFETTLLYPKNTTITTLPVYLGLLNKIDIGVKEPFWATIPKGSKNHLTIDIKVNEPLTAPLYKDQSVGTITAMIDDKVVSEAELYPVNDVQNSKGMSYYVSYLRRIIALWI